MQRTGWLLLTVAAAEGEPLQPVQLQKCLFLLGAQLPALVGEDFYEFEPYNYGPFCLDVYGDAEQMAEEGLMRIDRQPGRSWATYSATPVGLAAADHVRSDAPEKAVHYLARVVEWARRLSFRQLVTAIYEAYPEQRANSVFS